MNDKEAKELLEEIKALQDERDALRETLKSIVTKRDERTNQLSLKLKEAEKQIRRLEDPDAPSEVWVQQCHEDAKGFVQVLAHRPVDDHYTYRRVRIRGRRQKSLEEYPCDGCGQETKNPRVYCSKCMDSTGTIGKIYAPKGSCISTNGGYMDIEDVTSFMEYADKALHSYRMQLGKLPWVKTDMGSCGSPAYPLTCARCSGELDGLWCSACQIGLSILCPKCNIQASLKHGNGLYWCFQCREEFSAYIPDIMVSVVTTAGECFGGRQEGR